MSLNTLSQWLSRLALIVVGIAVGIGLVILVQMNAAAVLDAALLWGAAAGVGAFLLAALLYAALRPKAFVKEDDVSASNNTEAAQQAAMRLAARLGLPEEEVTRALPLAKQQLLQVAQLVARFWSSATALGAAVAITGSVIAMVTAVAALRQVDRIDAQNALLEQQIEEAQASRAASVFAAQLPSLLAAIDEERGRAALSAGADALWLPSDALLSRIQALIDTAEPYATDREAEDAMALLRLSETEDFGRLRFSPQRAQLFRILQSSRVNFQAITPPLDFSNSDFRGLTVNSGVQTLSLGRTILRNSNFRGVSLANLDVSQANLRGIILDTPQQLSAARTFAEVELSNQYMSFGTNFDDAVLLNAPVELEELGWIGNGLLRRRDLGEPQSVSNSFAPYGQASSPVIEGERSYATLNVEGEPDFIYHADLKARAEFQGPEGSRVVYRLGEASVMDGMSSQLSGLSLLRDFALNYMTAAERAARAGQVTCEDIGHGEALERLRDLMWYSAQPRTHEKIGEVAQRAIVVLGPELSACVREIGPLPRRVPDFIPG